MAHPYFAPIRDEATLTEYLNKRKSGQPLGDPILLQYRENQVRSSFVLRFRVSDHIVSQSNAMQVTMGLEVVNGLMVLPAGFPGYEKFSVEHAHTSPEDLGPCLLLSLPSLQLHLRTNDYYMGK